MKILNISLDASILKEGLRARKRHIDYSRLFEELHILILYPGREQNIGNNIWIYSVSGNKIVRFFRAYQKAKTIMKARKIDFITCQDPFFTGAIGWFLKRKFKTSLHLQVHTDFLSPYFGQESLMNKIRVLLAKFLLRRADKIRVVSQRIKKSLLKLGIIENKIIVAPIYSEFAKEGKSNNESKKNKFVFLTVGRLVAVKNIGLQIQAMEEISKKYLEAELWIIGDGPEKRKLIDKVKKARLENKIKFFGWKNDLEEFYQQADAFVLISNYEGWGMVVIEAARYGLPIIITDVGCANEVIINNESGILISVGNKNELIRAMNRLIEDRNYAKEIGEKAKNAVEKLPNKQKSMELYQQSFS